MMPIGVIVASFCPMILHAMAAPSPAAKGGDHMQGPPQIWYPTPSHRTSSVARAHAGELGHAVLHQEVVTTRVKGVASSVDLEE